jgi:hypothetical protein
MNADAAGSNAKPASVSMNLLHMAAGAYVGQAISVAAKLGIADLLADGPKTPAALAEESGGHVGSLHRLLRVLASVGVFVEQSDGLFALTPLASCLRTDVTGSLNAFAIMLGEDWHLRAVGDLYHSVRTGEPAFAHVFGLPLYSYLGQNPAASAVFDAAITSRAQQENAATTAAYDWPDGTIVDVGGGQGALLAAILAQRQNARGVLFELPHVAENARTFLASANLTERCRCVAGNAFETVPADGDLYVLRRVLHGQDDDHCATILRNCRAAMGPQSRLLVIEHVLEPGNALSWGKMLDVQMLILSAGGRERNESEFRRLLASAGLTLDRIISTETVTSLIEASPAVL